MQGYYSTDLKTTSEVRNELKFHQFKSYDSWFGDWNYSIFNFIKFNKKDISVVNRFGDNSPLLHDTFALEY